MAEVHWRDFCYPVAVPDFRTDYIQGALMNSGRPYEEEMLAAMAGEITEGDLVLDIGSNVGNHALFLAHVTKARVIAYEPNLRLVRAISASVAVADLAKRVTVRACAVGSAAARGRLDELDESNLGRQSVTIDTHGAFDVVCLDDERFDSRVRAIKIDVEGMELDVLRGAEGMVARDQPLLYVECRDREEFDTVEGWLGEMGYGLADTFNATPTHLFRPGGARDLQKVEALRRNAYLRYQLEARYQRMKEFLRAADGRSEAAQERLRQLSLEMEHQALQLKSANAAFERVRDEALLYRSQRDELRAGVEEIRTTLQAKHAELSATRKDSELQLSRLKAEHRRKLARLRHRHRQLENSRSVRLSRALKSLKGSPGDIARVALETIRIIRPERPKIRSAPAAPARSGPVGAMPRAAVPPVPRGAPDQGYEPVVWKTGLRDFDSVYLKTRQELACRSGELLAHRLDGGARLARVAAITDDFTRHGLSPECEWLDLTPTTWADDIREFPPDVLFVESAWRGKSGSWHNTVSRLPQALQDILAYCRDNGVPTLFWNKEDPVHFDTFIRTAAEFDHVFTTDIDCISRYRVALGHDRVHFMPFACQPRVHNPCESRSRREGLAFAGGYYTRYKERMRDLEELLQGATDVMPVDIYDRNLGTTYEEYSFPHRYRSHIVGTLSPDDLDVAYKGYRFALNLNSVKGSQSMFARRAYELLACGTVTLSNYAHGLDVMLGDLVPMGDSKIWARTTLSELKASPEAYDRLRLLGLRKVHSEHTYAARLNYLLAVATGRTFVRRTPHVDVLVPVNAQDEVEHMRTRIESQTGVEVRTTFVTDESDVLERLQAKGLRAIAPGVLHEMSIADFCDGSAGVAIMDPSDWHGPNYLVDLVLALTYSGADVVGRQTFATARGDEVLLPEVAWAYSMCSGLSARSALVSSAVGGQTVASLLHGSSEALDKLSQFTIDRFDYCRDGAGMDAVRLKPLVGSSDEIRTGNDLAELYHWIDNADRVPSPRARPILSPSAWLDATGPGCEIEVNLDGDTIIVTSLLDQDRHAYLWLRGRIPVDLIAQSGTMKIILASSGDLDVSVGLRFVDGAGNIIQSMVKPANCFVAVPIPKEAVDVTFAIRVRGSGTARIHEFTLDHPVVAPPIVPGTADYLVVTNHYPSYDDLYRNGFVHSRVRAYREAGLAVDVFRFRETDMLSYHEFDGVEVATGSAEALRATLSRGQYEHVLVHFLSPDMWSVLREFADKMAITIWIHGAEVQPWWRRKFNYTTPPELERAKAASESRLAFWRSVADELSPNTHFVFVSQHFADEVMEDLERDLPLNQVHVVHNPVNTTLFDYVPKSAEQRLRVLSIRPYTSATYANDLSVAAVLDLAQEEWFDQLQFHFRGDGPLFDEILAPLRDLPNVQITRGFLTQPEIASIHKNFGVFLAPTRCDSQGVSKDEAMSSGLVPITSDVAAIPEFVSKSEGYLAKRDDHIGLADAIRDLHDNPDVFLKKSAAAAARVRSQTAMTVVMPRELDVLARGVAVGSPTCAPAGQLD